VQEKSLARLVYETKRSLQGRQHQVEKRRGKYGHFEPNYKRTSEGVRRVKKTNKGSRYGRREGGEVSEQSLSEEIKGSGVLGPFGSLEERERARKRLEELGLSAAGGISNLTAEGKRAIQRSRE